MQLQLISFVLILRCMEYTNCQQHASRHRHKQTIPGCQSGCLTCSEYNGCLSCKPRLFIFLERNGMKQTGVCLPSCPSGYYGTRSPDRNDCTKCRPECDSCFTSNFCTRCRPGFYLHQGKCLQTCPEGRVASTTQRECVPECPADCDNCVNSDTCTRCAAGFFLLQGKCLHTCPEEYEPSDLALECIPQVHCEVDEWSEWSPCSRPGKTCGFKRGEESRTRKVLRTPSPQGNPCPPIHEKRDCVVKKKKCPGRRPDRKNRNNRRDKENTESRHERKRDRDKERKTAATAAAAGGEQEDSENRNKTERRRRRGHARNPTSMDGGTGQ
ncbi:R-spondin-3 [Alosa pseudoharengus]|uniref:R-spondin-3 n=1 Tax=Alosa sapidissima TaxID=34773 RepID=UPI001C094BA4|nr:R-spondin-3 [Alosa sapidissima]